MSLLDILDEKILTPSAAYIKILSQYKTSDNTIFCLVEGVEDNSFYRHFIEIYKEDIPVKYIVCNGKQNVIDNYNELDWDFYDKKRVLFFIDKDFDDYIEREIINDENVFITDCYSIENYLVDENILEKFITDNCLITTESVIKLAVENFRKQHKVFVKQLKMISSWMMYCRKNNFEVCFNDIKMSDLFKIDDEGNLTKKTLSTYRSKFEYLCDTTQTNYFNLNEIRYYYNLINEESKPKKFIRGKYELYFMFMYLKYISENVVNEISNEVKQHNRNARGKDKIVRPKSTIPLKEENIFQVLYNKTKVPEKLKVFIETL
ncbi:MULTISPECIES: DUF4435 domain-containing protein [Chryseobacterium]|uniref:DUF4435 domain-containing protein n=1 Tax=Chryseobacterium taihuense TaxID=1141221 RepID=A0A4U8W9L2_9FLAO|nr:MULTISPECIES: DUF4435 domain-containing protein [Chryseobacterium]QQV01340.1 DUF4435 domain-containing protein [Chryseobacterium sp. FDAARGOS 1104]VFB02066.1 Uncharacterised protein [Chryseobacterium taihuense]